MEIARIASKVRHGLELYIQQRGRPWSRIPNLDTSGYCAIASAALYEVLVEHHLHPTYVATDDHVWVEVDGMIIDLTADQMHSIAEGFWMGSARETDHYDYTHGPSTVLIAGVPRIGFELMKWWDKEQRPNRRAIESILRRARGQTNYLEVV